MNSKLLPSIFWLATFLCDWITSYLPHRLYQCLLPTIYLPFVQLMLVYFKEQYLLRFSFSSTLTIVFGRNLILSTVHGRQQSSCPHLVLWATFRTVVGQLYAAFSWSSLYFRLGCEESCRLNSTSLKPVLFTFLKTINLHPIIIKGTSMVKTESST